jgi:hypothetical protein
MERMLLLWDELDELVGYGRHMAVDLGFSLASRGRALKRLLTPARRDFNPEVTQVLN